MLIDDQNIKDVTKKSLRNLMGIVSQDSILFNDTIANNIKLGTQAATEEAILEAAQIANADEFIQNLPEKYKQILGIVGILFQADKSNVCPLHALY